ncbi:hypothetical protein [Burkholderia cepacia]|uniref:hypothetical protein n=1 Tax=Burkholderia cepacia TaxID=292 RepID=UPI002AB72285|nr:hypothetical protein [Burkholderia cepacia]
MDQAKAGFYTVDFTCDTDGAEVSVFNIRADNAVLAERSGRESLNPGRQWRSTAIDRVRDAD